MTDLAGFLLARIAEDEAAWSQTTDLATRPDFAKLSRHMLAECEAKRRVVGLWNLRLSIPEPEYGLAGGEPLGGQGAEVYYDALKALALPYADHPEYRAEWRP